MCQCNPERMLKYCGKGKCVEPLPLDYIDFNKCVFERTEIDSPSDIDKITSVMVLGKKIPVIEKQFSDDREGEFDSEKMTIFISPSSPRRKKIIFHGMICAALYISGDLEETFFEIETE